MAPTRMSEQDDQALALVRRAGRKRGLDIQGGRIRKTSSRLCLSVEHGDYNGTDLFGLGTDRFIWLAYKANGTGYIRLFSENFPQDGVVEFICGQHPQPYAKDIEHSWARFAFGVNYILDREGFTITSGFDGVIVGNIPGGGMSRSASLTVNLLLTLLEVNHYKPEEVGYLRIARLAQSVENDYVGSPCGILDPLMILFARKGMGTVYSQRNQTVTHVSVHNKALDPLRLVVLDTGTKRPGLEKSTYKVRRQECDSFVATVQAHGFSVSCLADVRDPAMYHNIVTKLASVDPIGLRRLTYLYHAQKRFDQLLQAWSVGHLDQIGQIFRKDGLGLRDDYEISGPELETMCDIARAVPGVLGERMLGGGDKGAVGVLVHAKSVALLKKTVELAYPRSRPQWVDGLAVHVCRSVDGVSVIKGKL